MRVLLVCLLACLHIVHCQTYPFLRHNGVTFQNNSFIDRGIVSVTDKLECVTNHSPCCEGSDGGWTDPAEVAIQEGPAGTIPFYVTRTAAGTIDLNRLAVSNGQEQLSGMYECEIPGSGGTPEMMFIYLGNQSTGQLTSAVVSFTELLSEVNEEPEFVLTCRSEGGPATTVQWTRDSTAISDPSTVLRLVDRQQNTVYESRLTVTGRDLVDYSCTVSSNRSTYFGEAGSSVSSEAFTVSAAGEPTRLNAVDLLSSGSILVTWTPPSGSVTGYTVFLEPGGVEETVPSSSDSHMVEGLQSGTQYMVSLVALSDQLPSMVVGPLAPTNLEPPDVSLTATTTNPTVGGSLQLECTVVLPEGIELSGNPQVEFYGPGDGMDEGPFPATVTPSSGSYLAQYSFENLDLFSHGVYRCSAIYTIEASMSPAGEATLNVDVTFGVNEPGLEIAGVPYVSNTVTLTCAVFLSNSDITTEFMWSRVGGGLPPSASIGSVETGLFIRENTLTLSPLAQLDSGEYRCQVTISTSPGAGTIPTATLDESDVLTVLIPEVTVATEPETQRVLDHEEYNSFTITCSASATADTTPLVLGFVSWDRRVDSGEFQPVSADSYSPLTGSPEDGYVSRINGTESTASTTVQFRCHAALTETSSFSTTSTATVTVQGPAAPMSVSLRSTDVTDTTAIISWTVPSIAYTPETYRVLYGTTRDSLDRTSGQQRTSGSDISVTSLPLSLPLSGLDPDTAYYYTVNASNSYSFTLHDTNTFNTSSRRPNPPTNLAVTQPSGLTYGFTWTASTAAPGAPPIVSYTLTCDPTLDGVDDVKRTTPDNSVTSGSVSLSPGLSYTCCVVATSNGVAPSNKTCLENLLTTPPSAPTGGPVSLVAVAGRRNLMLSWSPPEPRLRNGDISSYVVTCSSPSSSSPDFSDTIPDTQVMATGLTPNTMYSCSVLATNSVGSGPLATVDASTLEDAPDAPPQDFRHSVVNGSQRVEFSWAPPPSSSANGAITGYAISCNPPFYQSTTELSLNVTTLTPGTSYSCNISASTAVGAGPPTTPLLSVLTVPGAPEGVNLSVVEEEKEEGLLVMWGQVEGIVSGYRLTVTKTSSGDTVVLTSSGPSLLVRSDKVGGFEMVSIEVSGVNSAGYGPPSDSVSGTTPSIPPGPVAEVNVTVEDGTLTVEWNTPPYPNGILSGYMVSVETYPEGVVKFGPPPVDNSTFRHELTVSSLEDGTPYYAVVVAVNDKGNGEKNPTIFFSNELASGPVALTPENQRRSSNGDILLSWEKPSPVEARGIITSFEISFSESGAGEGGRRKRQECPRDQCQLGAGQTSGCCIVGPDQTNVTISGLDSSKSYDVSVSVVNGAGVGEAQTFTIEGNPPEDKGGFPVAIVAVVVVLVVAVVLPVVVIVVIVVLIRCRKSKTGGYSAHPSAMPPGVDEDKRAEEMVSLSAINPTSPEEAARMRAIRLDQFEEHVRQMHEDRDKGFEQEYLTFSTEPTAVHAAAKDPKNKNKNRFANIFPYDFNRVPLQLVDGAEGSDYINASFVHGYSRSNAYIAAQGPMSGTILDFWRMIWEHRPGSIVMLTRLVEGGKRKCELYWPEKVGDTFKAGCGIHVQYKEVVPYADFEIKKFIVTNDQKPKVPALEVQHFQFLSWPDHGVPKFSTALISFIRRLRQYHNPQSAMLVHCSAGVGRTGAFILLDSMLEKIASESSVNVYECLTKMRQQRIHLVQTLVQYVFIHDALVELVTCGDTSVPAKALRGHIKKMVRNIPGEDVSGFTAQFRLLARVSRKPSDSDNSEGLAPHNKDKNRYPGRIPYNMNRVRLKPTGVSGAEYINASFLDGYKQKNAYMAAQAPVAATVNDFWRMVWEFKSRAVVMLCQLEENGQEMSHQYWPTQLKAKQLYGKNSVTLISEEHPFGAKEIVVRKFEITDEKNTAVFTVTQYHVLCWAEEGKMAAGLLLQMISDLNKLQRNTENKPITVLCNDGMGRTGAFICVHAMLDRVNSEHILDFFQFVKSSRINRPDIVREEEHYVMCHETVAEYLDSFQTYANFT